MSILDDWELTPEELTLVVGENPSLRGMLFGYVAELKLREYFSTDRRITNLRKDDDHDRRKKGDLVVTFRDHEFKIESKSLQTNSIRHHEDGRFTGKVQCDASDRRTVTLPNGEMISTTCLVTGEFDILAACLFEFTKEWTFIFALNEDLPRSTYGKYTPGVRQHLLKTLVDVSWPPQPPFVTDPLDLLDRLSGP